MWRSVCAVIAVSDLAKDKVVCGTWQYWLLVLSVVPLILVVSIGV